MEIDINSIFTISTQISNSTRKRIILSWTIWCKWTWKLYCCRIRKCRISER